MLRCSVGQGQSSISGAAGRRTLSNPSGMVTMRLDADLLRWLRRRSGYQARVNAILRAYMRASGSS